MTHSDPLWGLPDPDRDAEFYADTAAKRLLAWLIDNVIIGFVSLLVLPFTAFVGIFFFAGILLTVGFVYRVVTIARNSATPGMQLLAIEFRTARGERFDLLMALLHTTFYLFMWAVTLLQLVSVVLMGTTARGQGLHDLLLGTAVINRPARL